MFRVLFAIGQTPFDPTSGAAQATLHLAEMLAGHGCEVHCLSTSGTEGNFDGKLPTGSFTEGGVNYQIFSVSPEKKHSWHHLVGREYDDRFDQLLSQFQPDFLFTFGDEYPDQSRRARAIRAGVKVVFCLHNAHYSVQQPSAVHAFLTPSDYLSGIYCSAWGRHPPVIALPTPIIPGRVVAKTHDPVFTTFINPQPAKGLWFMIRLAEQLGLHHPDIPLRVIEGRATAAHFIATANSAGIDLTRFPNLFFSPAVADVREIWATTRILLAPSVWNEPAGRVAVEAMLNGAVPIVSDRGGLPEQIGAAGISLSLPPDLTPESSRLPSASETKPWLNSIVSLCQDESDYATASAAARAEASRFAPVDLGPRYLAFLRHLI